MRGAHVHGLDRTQVAGEWNASSIGARARRHIAGRGKRHRGATGAAGATGPAAAVVGPCAACA